ncbi:MAG: hypothetical protein AB1626_03195 [Candidatus Micrarchaeota archaeon]
MAYHSLSEVKQTVGVTSRQSQTPPHRYMPMFLPTSVSPDAQEKGAMEITTRDKFLKSYIPLWLDFVTYKPLAIMLALGAIATFTWNIYVCTLLAIGAGYYYGGYAWRTFFIDKFLKKRWLYEGT